MAYTVQFRHTTRGRLILIVAAALLPALGVIFWTGLEQRDEAVRNAEQQVLLLTRHFAERQQELTATTEQILRTLADVHRHHEHDANTCLKILRAADDHNDIYSRLLIVSPDGRVRISSKGKGERDVSERKYFRDVLASKSFSAGEYVVDGDTGHATIHFVYPLLNRKGEIGLIFAAALDLDVYWDFLKKIDLPPGYRISIVDHRGARLVSYPDRPGPATGAGTFLSEENLRQIRSDHGEGLYEALGNDGVHRIHAFRKLYLKGASEPHMIVTVGADKASILEPASAILGRNLLLLGLTFAVALGGAWLFGGASIVNPVRRLMEAARQLRDGNLSARTEMSHFKGELGILAKSFDEMASALEAKTVESEKYLERLRESDEQYRGIFENTIVGIYQSTLDGRYLTVNPALASMFGYDSPEEMIASVTDIGAQLYDDPEDRRRAMEILTVSDRLERFEARFRRRDGAAIWTLINSRSVRDADGQILFIEGVIEDITEQKQAGQERARLEEQLRQAQKMEALGTLAGGIAHDFNNVLMAIIGFTELAGIESDEKSRRECLDQVLTASRRAKDLVNQILTFSRMRETERRPVQVNHIVKEALKLLRSSIPTTIDIRSTIGREPVVICADPTQIHQVLMNLCTNAAHAMKRRRGTLSVSLTQERFGNGSSPAPCGLSEGLYARLQVSDTGHGMSRDVMERVYDPFFTTKPHGEGTGLGLSVVYGIVQACRGAIDIHSKPGKGTAVSVYLPAEESAEKPDRSEETVISTGVEHILFIDDEPVLADLGARALRSLGYRVTARTSSLEALDFFRSRHKDIDLVITDVTMPYLTGAELTHKMLEVRRDTPVVLCTGFSEMVNEETARRIGARGYIVKPVSRAVLAKTVRDVLDSGGKRVVSRAPAVDGARVETPAAEPRS